MPAWPAPAPPGALGLMTAVEIWPETFSRIAFWPVVGWLVLLGWVDARSGLLPNRLVLPGLAGLTVAAAALAPTALISGAVAAAPYLLGFHRGLCGGGDVKLAAACGLLLADPLRILLAGFLAAAGTLVLCALARRRSVPHGPVLAVATILLLV